MYLFLYQFLYFPAQKFFKRQKKSVEINNLITTFFQTLFQTYFQSGSQPIFSSNGLFGSKLLLYEILVNWFQNPALPWK